jgi:tetratricopeptide (TPR) repeat protein
LEAAEPPPGFGDYVSDLAVVVRAEVARAEGDPERALAVLDEAPLWTRYGLADALSPLIGHYYPVFLRAELLREAGRSREALRWYRSFPVPMLPPATLARLRSAEILESLGETERASELYREVRERWGDADREVVDAHLPRDE